MTTDACIKAWNSMGKTEVGGVKFDDGKPDYTLIPWDIVGYGVVEAQLIMPFYRWWRGGISASDCTAGVLEAYNANVLDFVDLLAQSLNYGATKYEAWNWELGISRKRLYAAACRHFKAIYDHGMAARDAESGLYHTAHLAFYAVAITKAPD